jgi:hypothetical protein
MPRDHAKVDERAGQPGVGRGETVSWLPRMRSTDRSSRLLPHTEHEVQTIVDLDTGSRWTGIT